MIPALLPFLAAAAATAPICTDRPSKANGVCTVPAGHIQLEANVASWSLTRTGDIRSEQVSAGQSFLKIGLSARSDLQLGFTPFSRLTVTKGGTRARLSGFGDIVVRYKHRLTNEAAKVQVGIIPFVKLPTARHRLGNGEVEGGITVPISLPLSGSAALTFGPEADLLADADGHGRHAAIVNLANVAAPIAPRLILGGELWTSLNFDPAGTVRQASLDGALAYALSNYAQLDLGSNIGLTRDTPDIELYAGASIRF